MRLLSFLFPQTVFRTTSAFSGEIKVIDHVFERRLVVGGLTQSGGILKGMWKKALKELRIKNEELRIKNVLVLGLGAGTVAEIISKKWPDAHIVGVEIDPAVIETGKKYFHLNEIKNLEIIVADAVDIIFHKQSLRSNDLKSLILHHKSYDLIVVDIYKGKVIEKELQKEHLLQKMAQLLTKNGVIIFNVLRPQNDNFEARIFLDKLGRIYKDYFCKRIITNDFFFCSNYHQRR